MDRYPEYYQRYRNQNTWSNANQENPIVPNANDQPIRSRPINYLQEENDYRTFLVSERQATQARRLLPNRSLQDHHDVPRRPEANHGRMVPTDQYREQNDYDGWRQANEEQQPYSMARGANAHINGTKPIPITSWKVYFTGETTLGKDEHGVNDFITLVNLHKTANRISDENMSQNIGLLLRKSALSWYIGEYRNMRTWSEFIVRFRQKYLSDTSNFEILSEIENRTQQRNEDAVTYINNMVNRFPSMPTALAESHQCHIIQRNLSRANAMKISAKRYTSIIELEKACRNMESTRKHLKLAPMPDEKNDKFFKFKPRPQIAAVDHSDSAGSEEEYDPHDNELEFECDAISSKNKMNNRSTKPRSNGNKPPANETLNKIKNDTKCYNCRQKGHWFMECPIERTRVFCFRCGKDDLITPECPECSPKNGTGGSPKVEEPRSKKDN